MAKLKDKCNLFQWDINQKLTGLTCKYVDFVVDKNGTKEVYRVEVVNGVCPIPDEFFQRAGKKIIYEAYEDGTYKEVILTVNPRPVPPDYAYTPTEQMTFDGLVLKVNTLVESVTQMVERGDFNGEDGFSPIIKVDEVTGGYRITIINKDGPSVFYVKNGHDGFDGFSPIAKVERTATGAIITITDKSGTTTAVINDGQGSGGGNVDDVLVNGVSVVSNKVANINVPPPYDDTEIKEQVASVKADFHELDTEVQNHETRIENLENTPSVEGVVRGVNDVLPNPQGMVYLTDATLPAEALDVEARNAISSAMLFEETIGYIEPLAVIDGYRVYPVESNNTLYLNQQTAFFNTVVFQVVANKTYRIKSETLNPNNYYGFCTCPNLITSASGTNQRVGTYTAFKKYDSMGTFEEEFTPTVDGYLYVQITKQGGLSGDNIVATLRKSATINRLNTSVNSLLKNNPYFGLYFNGTQYIQFTQLYDNYVLCRLLEPYGINNLLQVRRKYIARLTGDNFEEVEPVVSMYSDMVGPVSIARSVGSGAWSGGTHSVNIDGTEYPTARQNSIRVCVANKEVTRAGIYYGETVITTKNTLYFPSDITGANLPDSAKAIEETRIYTLNTKLNIKVTLKFLTDVFVAQYYGCQIHPFNEANTLLLADNCEVLDIANLNNTYSDNEPEHYLRFDSSRYSEEIIIRDFGLGSYRFNEPNTPHVIVNYPNKKTYYILIKSSVSKVNTFSSEKVVAWESDYIFKIK